MNINYEELGFTVGAVTRLYHKLSQSKFAQAGILFGQPPILDYLYNNDGCIQNSLACALRLEPATITSVLSNMERDGLIERRPNENDKRVSQVFLTDKGRETRLVARNLVAEIAKECFDGFSDEEIEQTVELLTRIRANLCTANKKQ